MKGLVIFLVGLFLLLSSVTSSFASPHNGPRIKLKNGTSTNWSGYAALTNLTNPAAYSVSDVKGTWTIPILVCDTTATYSSAWVGIDGYNNSSVEQLGTEQDCSNGTPTYYAWYEMYPKPSYRVKLSVKAGDIINGEVRYTTNGNFVLSLTNTTTGKSFLTTQKSNKALRQSAEWIVEAPWSGGVLPLADFGTMPFSGSLATIGSTSGSISSLGFQYDQINMAASDGTVKATTSTLSNGGSDFTITWDHN